MAFEQTTCQKCGSSLISRLFCFSCNTIQTFSKETDYFELLGFSVNFEVDLLKLEERYQELSLELHPDFYNSAPESEKILSENSSAILNRAYKTLCDPTLRASYLLNLFSKNEKLDERSLPEGFLGEMFFLQESLDELLESGDKDALLKMRDDLLVRKTEIEGEFAIFFKNIEEKPNDSGILQQLQTKLNAERYLCRLLERIN